MKDKKTTEKDRVRAPRFRPKERVIVNSKTIGTYLTYKLSTENLSRSGMLLEWQQNRPIPFIENTILEMTIDPDSRVLGKPLQCLGKIVRRKKSEDHAGETQFGVSIIQIEQEDMEDWHSCIDELSLRGAEEIPGLEAVESGDLMKVG